MGRDQDEESAQIVDEASLADVDEGEAWSRPVVSLFPFSFDGRVNATQDIPVGSRI